MALRSSEKYVQSMKASAVKALQLKIASIKASTELSLKKMQASLQANRQQFQEATAVYIQSFAIDQKIPAVPSAAPKPDSQIKASQYKQSCIESSIKSTGTSKSTYRKGALGLSVNYYFLDSSGATAKLSSFTEYAPTSKDPNFIKRDDDSHG